MDGKEYCNKRVMLGKYRYLMAMVARRGKEAARWNDLAARPVGSGIGSARTRSGAQPVDIGAAKVNALAIEQECDELAEEARRERDRLAICIALVPDADSRDIFAQDPDSQGEVLVFYANSGDSADFIPAFDGTGSTTASYIEERLICAVAVGNATVTAVLSSEQYASYDDLQDHIADANNPHKVTKAQVGLGSVDNTSDVDKPVSTAQAAAIAACKVSAKSVTMLAASWVGTDPYTQRVVVDGAAANSKVDIQLSAEQYTALGDLGIDFLQIENANGTLTAKVTGGKPTSDLTVQVTIVGVVQ